MSSIIDPWHSSREESRRPYNSYTPRSSNRQCGNAPEAPIFRLDRIRGFENRDGSIHDEALEFVRDDDSPQREAARVFQEFFKCPICLDVLNEATTVSCGHCFCRQCIEFWIKKKTVCPVCQKRITTLTKNYPCDIALGSVADHLPNQWKERQHMNSMSSSCRSPVSSSSLSTHIQTMQDYVIDKTKEAFAMLEGVFVSMISRIFYLASVAIDWMTTERLITSVSFLLCCFICLLYCEQIIDFTQYMFYATLSYRHNSSMDKPIDDLSKEHHKELMSRTFRGQKRTTIFLELMNWFYGGYYDQKVV